MLASDSCAETEAELETGSLADWVAGVGTAGALLLGFSILLRDRQKEERAEASQVSVWFINQRDGTTQVHVSNGAKRPIVYVHLWLPVVSDDGRYDMGKFLLMSPVVQPDEHATYTTTFLEFNKNNRYTCYVSFRDSNGSSWQLSVRSGHLRRQPRSWRLTLGRALHLARSPRKAISVIRFSRHQW